MTFESRATWREEKAGKSASWRGAARKNQSDFHPRNYVLSAHIFHYLSRMYHELMYRRRSGDIECYRLHGRDLTHRPRVLNLCLSPFSQPEVDHRRPEDGLQGTPALHVRRGCECRQQ